MLEFMVGAVAEFVIELLVWLFAEIIGSLFSSRAVFCALSLILIGLYIAYAGWDRPAAWFRGGLLLGVLGLVDFVIAPWLRRFLGRAKL